MKSLKKALAQGWSVRIMPNYRGVTVALSQGGEFDRAGFGVTYKRALKDALKGL